MPGSLFSDPNWATDVTDKIVDVVGKVRDNTTNRAIDVVRGVVFGLLALVAGLAAVPLLVIFVVRASQQVLAKWVFDEGRAVWVTYMGLGMLLIVAGFFAMSKRFTDD
jgi:hypothetical protein